MEGLKAFLLRHFEQVFVLVILLTLVVINYFIPYKVAFLNFYFLPVIFSGFYLGRSRSMMGAFLCIIMVSGYLALFPDGLTISPGKDDIYFQVLTWGSFLVLAGAVVGTLQDRLQQEVAQKSLLNDALKHHQETLEETNHKLKDSKEAVELLKEKVENTLYATMDSTVAKLSIEGRLLNEKRHISVLFSDLVGFSGYSEDRSPEMIIRDLNHYISHMEPILLSFRGHIDKYTGDGIMVEFGAPVDFERYRLLAVLAGLKMQEKMDELDFPWKMRIGIASGTAIMGLVGSRRQAYTSIGDVVNLAARMEMECHPGSVLIDHLTLAGVMHFVNVTSQKSLSIGHSSDLQHDAAFERILHDLSQATEATETASLYNKMGRLHLSLEEYEDAVKCFEQAMSLKPDDVDIKVAFAEACVKRDEASKLQVKGRKQRVAAYEVKGLRDILLDREKIPEELYNRYREVVERIQVPEDILLPVEAVDGTVGHGRAVAFLTFAIASELGVSEKEKEEFMQAGFVADIGKEIVPHHILNRSIGSLSTSEIEEMAKHSTEGPRILRKLGYSSETMLRVVRHSHERFDGSGYPDGLKGSEIPLGSRIIAVVDMYDALTSWRPYRDRWDRKAACDEISRSVEKGTFDPEVVEILKRLLIIQG